MNKMMGALALAALAALAGVPAAAMQQPAPTKQGATRQGALPHTIRGEMTLYELTNYNGDTWVLDGVSATVHTDWNIRGIAIHPGDRWQICARSRFRDPCIVLDRSVPDASVVGIEGQIGSARPAPAAAAPAQ